MRRKKPNAFLRPALLAAGALALVSCGRPAPLKVGVLLSLTGSASLLGDEARYGIEFELERLAADPAAPRIELLVRDDEAKPERAAALVAELAAEGCDAIIGPLTSGLAFAAAEAAARERIPLLSPTVSAAGLAGKDDWFFRLYPTTDELSRFLGARAAARGVRRAAVLGDASNAAFAEEWASGFGEALAASGGAAAFREIYSPTTGFDSKALIDGAKAADPDALLLVASSTQAAILLGAARREGLGLPVYSSTWAFTSYAELLNLAGPAAEGLRSVILFDPDSQVPSWKALDGRTRQDRDQPASPAIALGAESLRALALARQKGGGSREALRSNLRDLSFEGLQGRVRLDDFGDADRPVYECVVADGRLVAAREGR